MARSFEPARDRPTARRYGSFFRYGSLLQFLGQADQILGVDVDETGARAIDVGD
jgi:hypothetical protein